MVFQPKQLKLYLNFANIFINEIDRVAMATATLPPAYFYTARNSTFTIKDYWKEQREYWYPKLYEGKDPKF